ncbi:N-acetylmuramoyl-L-alanine amidase, partial [Candidatus Poribacteria bacterium]|nr:N-acetylmuramoyl-L-alanine amidase [Candidatus Poribacteria bacterium]
MTSAKCWRTAAVVCLLTLAAVAGTAATVDGHYTLKTVVIDAGHGGKDPGATNRWGLREKDITLAVSLRLRDYLREKTSLNLVMTRDGDTYPTLPERAQIANRYEPLESVFVSIHCNASTNSAANGAETYVYDNEASDAKAQRVAARENQGQDFSLSFILNDLRHRAMKPYTDALADKIQDNLVSSVKVVDRRVQR